MTNTSRSRLRVGGVGGAIIVALLVAPGAALAEGSPPPPPPNLSGAGQYVEVVPTGGGGTAGGAEKPRSSPIPTRIGTLIKRHGGRDAVKLRAIVSSSAYGAPQQRVVQAPTPVAGKVKPSARPRRVEPRSPSALSAAISASGSGTGGHALWLGAILAVTTLAALVTAGLRQRRRR